MFGSLAAMSGYLVCAFLFGEDQARYLVTTEYSDQVAEAARDTGVPALVLGVTSGDSIEIAGLGSVTLDELRRINESWMPAFMTGPQG